ncbi:hypothetical protein ACVWYQ_003671 [Bradyrhizobium sp. USDA 3397]
MAQRISPRRLSLLLNDEEIEARRKVVNGPCRRVRYEVAKRIAADELICDIEREDNMKQEIARTRDLPPCRSRRNGA